MRRDELRNGVRVRFTEDSGLDENAEYTIFKFDPTSDTVRLEGHRGSFSVSSIVGISDETSASMASRIPLGTIPANETGILNDAIEFPKPAGIPSVPKKKPDASDDEAESEPEQDAVNKELSSSSILDGLSQTELLDVLESHLIELIKLGGGTVVYHARSALQIVWFLEEGGPAVDTADAETTQDA